jgi:hypothetical protein
MMTDLEARLRLRALLAVAEKECEHPRCTAQATGVLQIGKTAPYLCDPHMSVCIDGKHPDHTQVRSEVMQHLLDAEHRTRYPNGLTKNEWLFNRPR